MGCGGDDDGGREEEEEEGPGRLTGSPGKTGVVVQSSRRWTVWHSEVVVSG